MSHCNTVHRKTTGRAAMVRRGRTVQPWIWAWSEIRQDINAVEMIQALDRDREREERTPIQIGDSESDDDDLLSSQAVWEVMASFNTQPVIGESFCQCYQEERPGTGFSPVTDCLCGEEDQSFEWVWDEQSKSSGALLSCGNRKVNFHSDYSCGTAAIRGTKELADGQHYWEVKMTSPVYGTDMMVGIGTSAVNLEKFRHSFGSLLGLDDQSWGLSYTGHLQHKGDKVKFSSEFGLGSIIGLHLDTWHGTLTIYKNRHCIGVAATRLQNNKFYPMVCSTAAKSSMKVIRACCTPTSLQYLCCARLRRILPCCPDILSAVDLPAGLRTLLHPHLGWVFTLSGSPQVSEHHQDLPEDFQEETDLPLSPSPIPSLESTWSACDPPSPCTSPFPDTASYQCPCQTSAHTHTPCTCPCAPTPPSSDDDSCCSEPEDYHCKRCRWT